MMPPEVIHRVFKQGDQVLLQERGDQHTSISINRLAELAGDQPADAVITFDSGRQRTIHYEFQRETQVLFATMTRDDGRVFRTAELLDPRLAGDHFSLNDKFCGWRVTLNGVRPCIVRDGVPSDFAPLGVGDPVYGTAIFVGYDYMRDWGLCRLESGEYAVFLIGDIDFPQPTPEETYFVAELVNAV